MGREEEILKQHLCIADENEINSKRPRIGFGNHTQTYTHKFMRSVRKTKTMGRDASR